MPPLDSPVMTTTVRPQGRAQRDARVRQQARERNERLGLLLQEVHAATGSAVEAWHRGAPAFALAQHIEDAITRLRRAKARLILDAQPADPAGRGAARSGAAQRWASVSAPAPE